MGKSFAYLVPAILAAVHDKKKVVVSTHTIALQEQLLNKDIPFLQSVMGEEFTAVLVKGRSNYISLRRLNVAIQRQDALFQRVEEFDQLATIRMWSKRTTDGSRSDLSFRPFPTVWEAVQSEDGNCLGRECPNHKECFFYQARRQGAARQHADRQPRPVRHRPGTTRGGRFWNVAQVRCGDPRRGPHVRGGRRPAPGLADLQPGRRSQAGAAVQRAQRQRVCSGSRSSTPRSIN